MGPILVELERLETTLAAGTQHPLLGTGSVHASTIEGGRELSTYPEQCVLRIERRTIPGESVRQVETELKQLFDGAVRVTFSREPLETSPDEPVVETLAKCVKSTGYEPALVGAPFWTDAGLLADAGIPSVLFGPGGEGAHAAIEWVDLRDFERCISALVATAAEFCGAPSGDVAELLGR
jgi:acetylornithine deacetylase